MYAVLEDALKCFCRQFVSQGRHDQRLAREAKEWYLPEFLSLTVTHINFFCSRSVQKNRFTLSLGSEPERLGRTHSASRLPGDLC